jgi:hypothetical protein
MKIRCAPALFCCVAMLAVLWVGCGSDSRASPSDSGAPPPSDAGDANSACTTTCGMTGEPCCATDTDLLSCLGCANGSSSTGSNPGPPYCACDDSCTNGTCQPLGATLGCSSDQWCYSQVVDANGYPVSTFYGVWGTAANDVWAVGVGTDQYQLSGVMEHFTGSTWDDATFGAFSGGGSAFSGVWGAASTDVWAVSYFALCGPGLVHWNGTTLTTPSSNPCWFKAVWGSGSNDVWAVGDDMVEDVTWHWDGSSWAESHLSTFHQLDVVWGSGPNDVWAAGGCTFMHKDASGWTDGACLRAGLKVHGIWGSAANDVWAVGEASGDAGKAGAILHFNGSAWSVETNALAGLNAVWGSVANDVWAVGFQGTILHWDGATWSPSASGMTNTLYGIWGSSARDVWAVGDSGVLHRHL